MSGASVTPPNGSEFGPLGEFNELLLEETLCNAPLALKEKLYEAMSPNLNGTALVHLARVHFMTHMFSFDFGGRWSIVLPEFEGNRITDLAAFCVDDSKLRRPYKFAGSVGFESALWDAHYHPQRRLLLHYDVWSYLRAECVGCLPVSWRKTALALKQNDVRECLYTDDLQAARASPLLAAALHPPASFVLKTKAAA